MCPQHPLWQGVLDRLEGPEGCNFHLTVPTDQASMAWTCDNTHALSRKILADMKLTSDGIEDSLAHFQEHGGCCDCEILLNLGWKGEDSSEGMAINVGTLATTKEVER
jgi:hypothetical protein